MISCDLYDDWLPSRNYYDEVRYVYNWLPDTDYYDEVIPKSNGVDVLYLWRHPKYLEA